MIPLAVHSNFSLMQATASMQELVCRAKEQGYRALGISDIDNVYGLWSFVDSCAEQDILPIIGVEISGGPGRVFCFVKDINGYRNLCHLLTLRHRDPKFDLASYLPDFAKGICIVSDSALLLQQWREHDLDLWTAMLGRPSQHNTQLYRLAEKLGLTPVLLSDVFFSRPEDYDAYLLLRAIAENRTLGAPALQSQAQPFAYLASPAEYARRFHLYSELLRNTEKIAEKCAFRGPSFGLVLPPYEKEGRQIQGNEADRCLRSAAFTGARERYGEKIPGRVATRLEHELKIISAKGFSSYFLVVRDIVRPVSRTCGRGSGAASLVAYCLHITNVCPVKHNLYFERFLNPGRSDAPDIDIDFAWDERDRILDGVFKQFGNRAAMVCNHVLLQPKAAIREVAKVFGLPDKEISRISKKLPWMWRGRLAKSDLLGQLRKMPQLREQDFSKPWPEILAHAQKISGSPRYLSVHPGGVIITPDPTCKYVPVETAAKGVPIIQWEKDGAEKAGLVKIDLLGNRSLGVIRDALGQVRDNHHDFDERRWEPEDDPRTQKLVARGRTMGCFYIESPAMRLLQKKAGKGDFEHLVIHSSIIRPAANEWIREYLRRLHGKSWQPLHPLLEGVLDETFGIMVYQEDVSRVAVAFGFSHTDADRLRKIMSKKDKAKKLADFAAHFLQLAQLHGVSKKTADTIWQMMLSFDGYSFCKPHSASYARVSFQAAYLKAHFPAEFMAAVISNQGGYYSTFAYVSEARRLGLTILPPDVNKGKISWQGKETTLRVGLMSIRNLSAKTMRCIAEQRYNKKYSSFLDFLQRVRPDEDEAASLIRAGALDSLQEYASVEVSGRSVLFYQFARWRTMQAGSAVSLFDAQNIKPPKLPPEDKLQRLRNEYRALGFLCETHPITLFARQRREQQTVFAKNLPLFAQDAWQAESTGKKSYARVRFLGWLITGKIVGTKSGEVMEFLTFEDETGQVECTFFPEVYQRHCHLLYEKGPLLLQGYVEQEFGAITFTVEEAAAVPATGEIPDVKQDPLRRSELVSA